MKPTYPELLKAFLSTQKSSKTEQDEKNISETIEKLKSSEDWNIENEK